MALRGHPIAVLDIGPVDQQGAHGDQREDDDHGDQGLHGAHSLGRAPDGGSPAGLCEMLLVSLHGTSGRWGRRQVRTPDSGARTRRAPAPGVGNQVRAVRP
ncbi:hypothetical protein GCM10009548_32360 [Streptomyces malaysiensis subsp. malaysiensis]